ncbi:MAG: hypothetical protein ACREDR_34495, partial [Blastocatellia bacterium]
LLDTTGPCFRAMDSWSTEPAGTTRLTSAASGTDGRGRMGSAAASHGRLGGVGASTSESVTGTHSGVHGGDRSGGDGGGTDGVPGGDGDGLAEWLA